MISRALVLVVLFASALWPLHALACSNSMDSSAIFTSNTFWLDLFLWTMGAVFLNRVVIANVWGPATASPAGSSWARRFFFLLVGACLLLLLATVTAGGPVLNLSAHAMSECLTNRSMLWVLMASPTVVFVLQAVLFRKWDQKLFDGDRTVALAALVFTSVVLAGGVDLARELVVLPALCGPSGIEFGGDPYD
ncbi:hypothetical protein [Vitiosangium sp. GDMCC 1.1324]|uniref:hypothetical protein n=1 Tax=Vitiosangium sp. (strain GDMCC 1.1324) TaxID=2138576 RepID=UPI000D3BA1A5|nr:hypothetical protein [Vitiosangium sp. GDMCC 1.1324]PTL81594.1 hypothetical protein DAT35_21790 [Vitiosangium sp. GDMCC 1.1324]